MRQPSVIVLLLRDIVYWRWCSKLFRIFIFIIVCVADPPSLNCMPITRRREKIKSCKFYIVLSVVIFIISQIKRTVKLTFTDLVGVLIDKSFLKLFVHDVMFIWNGYMCES